MTEWNNPLLIERENQSAEEKRQIRKTANRCGVVLMILVGSLYLFSFLMRLFGRQLWQLLPTDFTGRFAFGDLANLVINLLFYVLVIPLLVLYCNKKSGIKVSDYLRFPNMSAKAVGKLVLMGVGVAWVSARVFQYVYQSIDTILRLLFQIEMNPIDTSVECDLIPILVLTLSAAVFAPLFEELLTRVGLLGMLRKYGGVFAAIATGVLFGFTHTNFQQIFVAAIFGIYASFIVYRTCSIWPAIFIHFTVNLISVLSQIALSFYTLDLDRMGDISYLKELTPGALLSQLIPMGIVLGLSITFMVLGIIGIVLLIKEVIRNPHEFTLPEEQTPDGLRTRDKCKVFFTAPVMILFLLFSLTMSFINAFL